jgi:hypothetical protein
MKLVDQWRTIADALADDWQSVSLVLATEQPGELAKAALVLGPLNAGRRGSELVFDVRRAGGAQGPEAARRLFARLDEARVWCYLSEASTTSRSAPEHHDEGLQGASTTTASWDAQVALLPSDWSDALCELELASSDQLPRAALLCAPLNPTRVADRLAFTFRCSGADGYGASPGMTRRCFERLDAEGLTGVVRVLRSVSDADNVATQGTVWLVDGKAL